MSHRYETLDIWKRTFQGDEYSAEKSRIIETYRKFWDRACELSDRIATDLPGLTLHDESHFEALWSRADQIVGPDYAFNPMELLVFGGSVLLHDAAHTLSVYPNGLRELRSTTYWQDTEAQMAAFAREQYERTSFPRRSRGRPSSDGEAPDFSPSEADLQFNVLRRLHAAKAEQLAFFRVVTQNGQNTFYLLDDDSMRTHLGAVMGLVAASHHWDIHEIERKLQPRMGAIAGFPAKWTIRPRVLACLLRCADATQVDQTRAPDFSYALLRGSKESETHWRAQNRLAQPYVEKDALSFTSTAPFKRSDARAWWLVCEALMMANKELSSAYKLMQDLGEPVFAIRSIAGAESPDELRTHILVEGWEPVPVGTKISDPKAVIELLGGRLLYDTDGLAVPIRELIQNASDAVRARRALTSSDDYQGRVLIEVIEAAEANSMWISVKDNGVGMSSNILTGPLLDFGKSIWRSKEVVDEFPGLSNRRIEQAGRYGIGFFSLMMATNSEIYVISRPCQAALNDTRTLEFPNGLLGPSILYDGSPFPTSEDYVTEVRFKVNKEEFEKFLLVETPFEWNEKGGYEKSYDCSISLCDRIFHMCMTIDCDIYVKDSGKVALSHSYNWFDEDGEKWLEKFTLNELRKNRSRVLSLNDIKTLSEKLMDIVENDRLVGRAAVSTYTGKLGRYSLHGFEVEGPSIEDSGPVHHFVGVLPAIATGPRRFSDDPALRPETLSSWATEQAKLWAESPLGGGQRLELCEAIADYGGDPEPVATYPVNGKYLSCDEVAEILISDTRIVCIKQRRGGHSVEFAGGLGHMGDFYSLDLYDYFTQPRGSYIFTFDDYSSSIYRSLDIDKDMSFVSILNRNLSDRGLTLKKDTIEEFYVGNIKNKYKKLLHREYKELSVKETVSVFYI